MNMSSDVVNITKNSVTSLSVKIQKVPSVLLKFNNISKNIKWRRILLY